MLIRCNDKATISARMSLVCLAHRLYHCTVSCVFVYTQFEQMKIMMMMMINLGSQLPLDVNNMGFDAKFVGRMPFPMTTRRNIVGFTFSASTRTPEKKWCHSLLHQLLTRPPFSTTQNRTKWFSPKYSRNSGQKDSYVVLYICMKNVELLLVTG